MMKDMSLFEKLKILVDVSSSSGLCIASIFILVFLAFIILTTNKKNGKSTKLLFLLMYIILLVIMLVQYWDSLSNMFDYMMNNFFIVVYFPNLAIYLAAIISTNIILWNTIFNYKSDKILKIINTIIYCIIHYLLVLILNVVSVNKLDVFDKSSVYGNNDALALIGLSSTIFIIWIAFLIIYNVIRSRQKVNNGEVEVKYVEVFKNRIPSNIVEVAVPKVVKQTSTLNIFEANNIVKMPIPSIIKRMPIKKQDTIVIEQPKIDTSFDVNNIIKMPIPSVIKKMPIKEQESIVIQQHNEDISLLKKYEEMLTLEDYKIVLNILKNNNEKDSMKENSVDIGSISIEDNSTNIDEVVEKEPIIIFSNNIEENNYNDSLSNVELEEEYVQPRLDELLNLYKSVQ